MPRIDDKRAGITTNIPESVLRGLKSPTLGFSWRYRDSSDFPFSADSHFYFSPFHFRLLLRRLYNTGWNIVWRSPDPFQPFYVAHKIGGWKWDWLRQTSWNTQNAFAKRRRPRATSLLNCKRTCIDKFMYIQARLASSIIICMHALHVITLKHCHIVAMGIMTLLQLPNSL